MAGNEDEEPPPLHQENSGIRASGFVKALGLKLLESSAIAAVNVKLPHLHRLCTSLAHLSQLRIATASTLVSPASFKQSAAA
jgi:hypothetical protein